MAGHSKWANIQHRKGRQDAKRGKLFTKLIREITVAARLGGADPAANPRLRTAIDGAKSQSMPKETIDRAIKRGAGGEDGQNLQEVRYEGYGAGGVAVLVDTMTDNKNRTVAEIRHAFSRHNGSLGTGGSVAYLFSKVGLISYPSGCNEDAIMEAALEGGAEDVIMHKDGSIDVLTRPDNMVGVKDALLAADMEMQSAEVTMYPANLMTLDLKHAEDIIRLLNTLEDLDDVQRAYCNADISDDILNRLSLSQ